VPTAYEPASVDNYATFSGGAYKKTDYVVATNYLDYLHFSFKNEFRINAGSADEIVDLFEFGTGTVIVLKTNSYGILANVALDLSSLTLVMRQGWGCVGRGAWTAVGPAAYVLSSGRGIMVIRQTDLGELLGVAVPLSAPVQKTIAAIDWPQAAAARLTNWDNKLYCAAPMTDGVKSILVFDFVASVRLGNSFYPQFPALRSDVKELMTNPPSPSPTATPTTSASATPSPTPSPSPTPTPTRTRRKPPRHP